MNLRKLRKQRANIKKYAEIILLIMILILLATTPIWSIMLGSWLTGEL
jgi:uncharacterized membrane protein